MARAGHRCFKMTGADSRLWPALAVTSALACGAAHGQQSVIIIGSAQNSRIDQAPYALTVLDREALRLAGPMVNVSEALQQVPGLVANNRGNYAQDLQISARGFGARASFGVRGLRLYADGIPASGPDGQGQVSHFDLASAQRIEVLRGPFSALYGNSSGGVIALVSAPVRAPGWAAGLDIGSFGMRQLRLSAEAPLGQGWDIRASASQMTIDGFRPHSGARKTQLNTRLGWKQGQDQWVVTLGHLSQPADDPLGLTRAQFDLGPRETAQQAVDYDTRKALQQTQSGAAWTHRLDDGALRELQLTGYVGQRAVTQWLAIPAGAQGNPRHGGGVINFERSYGGLTAQTRWSLGPSELVLGATWERQTDDRLGNENFSGTVPDLVYGVTGDVRRDERNRAQTRDVYGQIEWPLTAAWTLSAGLRHGRVALSSADHYLSNGDDSGSLDFSYTNPALALRWRAAPELQLHVSAARGFESPTLGELAYKPDGTGGFNANLKPQTSEQLEAGLKWRTTSAELDLAVFEARTRDELAVATNAGGRSSFQNVGRTLRRGLELGAAFQPASGWRARAAVSWLDATYRDGFLTCDGIPCNSPTAPVDAGNRIAGTPRSSGFGMLERDVGFWGTFAVEWRGMGSVPVNDRNTDFAAGYGVLAWRWTKTYAISADMRAEWLIRLDNLDNRHHAGSVIVNDGNARFFEPGAPRSVLLALRLNGAL
jgi:iron complex outermembrane receptor protein